MKDWHACGCFACPHGHGYLWKKLYHLNLPPCSTLWHQNRSSYIPPVNIHKHSPACSAVFCPLNQVWEVASPQVRKNQSRKVSCWKVLVAWCSSVPETKCFDWLCRWQLLEICRHCWRWEKESWSQLLQSWSKNDPQAPLRPLCMGQHYSWETFWPRKPRPRSDEAIGPENGVWPWKQQWSHLASKIHVKTWKRENTET